MKDILDRFSRITADPYKFVSDWKESNKKKVIGCFPMDIPEEIVHAADMLPVVIWRGNEPVTWGHAHLTTYNCGLVRSFIDDAVKGKLGFMDGMILWRQCLQVHELPYIIETNVHPAYFSYLYLPATFPGEVSRNFAVEEFERMKRGLEEFGGNTITVEALNRSIEIYNRNRSLLRKLYDLRRKNPGVLKAKEVLAIVQSSMLMPKEDHNKLLEDLLMNIEKKEASTDGKKKVVLTGSLCQTPQAAILDLIEDLGMVVVDDDMYIGTRYFDNDVEVTANPMQSFADRYFKPTPPSATKGDWTVHWGDSVTDTVRRNHADGVISLLIKFCPPHLCYYPDVKMRLREAEIPEVLIEVEHEMVSLENTRTRLQSFIESIGGL